MNVTHRTPAELRAEHKPRIVPVLIAALLVGVTACRNEPTRWNVGLDRSARTPEGTGEYVVLGGETEGAGPHAGHRRAT